MHLPLWVQKFSIFKHRKVYVSAPLHVFGSLTIGKCLLNMKISQSIFCWDIRNCLRFAVSLISHQNQCAIWCLYLCVFCSSDVVGRLNTRVVFTALDLGLIETDVFWIIFPKSILLALYLLLASVSLFLLRGFLFSYSRMKFSAEISGLMFSDVAKIQLLYTVLYSVFTKTQRAVVMMQVFPAEAYRCLLVSPYLIPLLSFSQNLVPVTFLVFSALLILV